MACVSYSYAGWGRSILTGTVADSVDGGGGSLAA